MNIQTLVQPERFLCLLTSFWWVLGLGRVRKYNVMTTNGGMAGCDVTMVMYSTLFTNAWKFERVVLSLIYSFDAFKTLFFGKWIICIISISTYIVLSILTLLLNTSISIGIELKVKCQNWTSIWCSNKYRLWGRLLQDIRLAKISNNARAPSGARALLRNFCRAYIL